MLPCSTVSVTPSTRAHGPVVGGQLLDLEHRRHARCAYRSAQAAVGALAAEVGLEHALIAPDRSAGSPCAITCPKSSTTMRSQADITRSMRCSTSITAIEPRSSRMRSPSSTHLVSPEAAGRLVEQQQLGLGDERAGERHALLHRIGERRRQPRATSSQPSSREHRSARARAAPARRDRARQPQQRARDARPCGSAGRRASRSRARSARGNKPTPCSVARYPCRRAGWSARCVKRSTLPLHRARRGSTNPQITLNSVVLPAPLGPMTPRTSPAATSSETGSSAVMPPNCTVSSCAANTAAPLTVPVSSIAPETTPSRTRSSA